MRDARQHWREGDSPHVNASLKQSRMAGHERPRGGKRGSHTLTIGW